MSKILIKKKTKKTVRNMKWGKNHFAAQPFLPYTQYYHMDRSRSRTTLEKLERRKKAWNDEEEKPKLLVIL